MLHLCEGVGVWVYLLTLTYRCCKGTVTVVGYFLLRSGDQKSGRGVVAAVVVCEAGCGRHTAVYLGWDR